MQYIIYFLLNAGIFLLDAVTGGNYPVWILYLIPIFFALEAFKKGHVFVLALNSILTLAGWFLPAPGSEPAFLLTHRFIDVAAFWLFWLLIYRNKAKARTIDELDHAKKRLYDTLESITDGFFSIDRSWRFIYLNEQAARLLGGTKEGLSGKLLWDAVPSGTPFEGIFRRCMEEKIPLRKEGLCPVNDRWYSCRCFPSAEGISVYLHDINDRKWAEEVLKKNEEMLYAALDNIPDVFIIYDSNRNIRFINSAARKLTGRPVSDFIGWRDEEIWPESVTSRYLSQLKRAIETRRPQYFEMTQHLPRGPVYTSMVAYVPLIDAAGEVYQVLGITHDITARKCAEEELKKAHDEIQASLDC
jgi:PAS domain S-box-containing protein